MKAKDIRVGDIIDGRPVTSVEEVRRYNIRYGSGGFCSVEGDSDLPATRPPTTVKPINARGHTVRSKKGGIMTVAGYGSCSGLSCVLFGQRPDGSDTWIVTLKDDDLEVLP